MRYVIEIEVYPAGPSEIGVSEALIHIAEKLDFYDLHRIKVGTPSVTPLNHCTVIVKRVS